jgi:deazaflavin-dependent oxidoreductase (nitroreductase family)
MDATLADEDYCYITTAGRVSGKPHTVEIWFGASGDTIYVLAERRQEADFVKNAKKKPAVDVRIGEAMFTGRARVAGDAIEDALARRLLLEKYAPPRYDGDLSEWGRDALPFAIDLDARG